MKIIVRRKQNSQRHYEMSKSTLDIEIIEIVRLIRNRKMREKGFCDSFMCSFMGQMFHALQKGGFLKDLNFVKCNSSIA